MLPTFNCYKLPQIAQNPPHLKSIEQNPLIENIELILTQPLSSPKSPSANEVRVIKAPCRIESILTLSEKSLIALKKIFYDKTKIQLHLPRLKQLAAKDLMILLSNDAISDFPLHWNGSIKLYEPLLEKLETKDLITLIAAENKSCKTALHFDENVDTILAIMAKRTAQEILEFFLMQCRDGTPFLSLSKNSRFITPLIEKLKTLPFKELMRLSSFDREKGEETSALYWKGSIKLVSPLLEGLKTKDLIDLLTQVDGYGQTVLHLNENFKDVIPIIDKRSKEEIIQFLSTKCVNEIPILKIVKTEFLFSLIIPLLKNLEIDEILEIKDKHKCTIFHDFTTFPLATPLLENLTLDKLIEILVLKDKREPKPLVPFVYSEDTAIALLKKFKPEELKELLSNSTWLAFISKYKLTFEKVYPLFEQLQLSAKETIQLLSYYKDDKGFTYFHDVNIFRTCRPLLEKSSFEDLKRVCLIEDYSGKILISDPAIFEIALPIIKQITGREFNTLNDVLLFFRKGS